VRCKMEKDSQGVWVCGIDGDDFCNGVHCDECGIALCTFDCGDQCDRMPTEQITDDKDEYYCVRCKGVEVMA